ncbi:LLM class flavin-dependent oxidoreductase [Streptomyces sp. NPDC059373]
MPAPTRPLHLAVAIDGRGQYGASSYVELAQLAERGALDFVTLDDSLAPPQDGTGRLDALAVLTRVAPVTDRIGLVPTVTTTHTEPFHVSAALATLDWVSGGRAGWTVDVSTTEAEARHFGRRPVAQSDALWREAGEVADVVARLWDSWEDDAEIRDIPTGRFIDRDKLHYVDFQGTGFSVKGPSIVPRPPQGHPVIAVRATDLGAFDVAARYADIVHVRAADRASAVTARDTLRAGAVAAGRDPGTLTVLADLAVDLSGAESAFGVQPDRSATYAGGPVGLAELIADWHTAGAVDGFHIRPAEPRRDLERFVNGTVALLQHRGLFRGFHPGTTLREHLGLGRPANRYALEREAAR